METQGQTSANQAAPAAPSSTPAPNGNSSASVRSNVNAAKQRMFGDGSKAPDHGQGATPAITTASPATEGNTSASPEGTSANPEPALAHKPADPQAAKPQRSPKDAQSIKKLVAQKHQLKSQVDALQAEIAELKKMQNNAPKQEDYATQQEYTEAKIEHNVEMRNASKQIEARQQALQHQQHAEWTQRCQETVKNFEEFAPRYKHYLPQMQKTEPEVLEAVASSAVGPRLLEEVFTDLFENDRNYAQWQALSPQAKKNMLAQVEANILRGEFSGAQPAANPQPAKSNAPAPITPDATQNAGQPSPAKSSRGRIEAAKRRMFGG